MHAISLHLVLNVFERTLMLLMLNFNISKPNRAICDVKTFCRPVRVGPPFLLLVPAPPVRVGPSVYPKKELMAKRTQFFFPSLSPLSRAISDPAAHGGTPFSLRRSTRFAQAQDRTRRAMEGERAATVALRGQAACRRSPDGNRYS
jgi:hypothetical protein